MRDSKKINIILLFGMFILGIVLFSGSSLAADVCCEKTVQGAWCQNDDSSNCDSDYSQTPTNCESTSFCKTGTCIDRSEGRCISNTPQTLCEEQGGFWDQKSVEEIPECQVGCCFLENGDTTPVTQTRCRSIASDLGVEVKEFRSDLTDQIQCLASATSPEEGACVIDDGIQRDCKHITRSECSSLETGDTSTEFNEGYLCSADFLGTICGASEETTCVEDRIHYLDTCGNIANIYDSNRQGDQSYWNRMIAPEDSCGYGNSNSLSENCGNCNYGMGSYCEEYERGKYPNNPKPNYGDYICSDLSCRDGVFAEQFREDNGRFPLHGESWCTTSAFDTLESNSNEYVKNNIGNSNEEEVNLFAPGEESYVLRCSNSEVIPESTSTGEWRQKICRDYVDPETGMHQANPIVNEWMSCLEQTTQEECEYLQERDCVWLDGHSVYRGEENKPLSLDENGNPVEASCVPKYSPAFDFWNPESSSPDVCNMASNTCVVKYKINLLTNAEKFGDWSQETKLKACTTNCYCLEGYEKGVKTHKDFDQTNALFDSHDDWINSMSLLCSSLGDCGTELNYIEEEGRYTEEDEIIDSEYFRKRKEFVEWAESQQNIN